jgi:hypothetical protein
MKERGMKTIPRLLGAVAAVVLVVVVLQWAHAGQQQSPQSAEALAQALAEAGKPGLEHKKLEPLVGRWTVTAKFWANPSQPPAEFKGTVERKWIMDGRFVQENGSVACVKTGKTFEGMGLVGYHPGEKKFSYAKACGLFGTISSGLVTCDSTGGCFECATEECCPLTGQRVKGRDQVVIENNDRIVVNIFKTIDGREVKVGEMVSIRQK